MHLTIRKGISSYFFSVFHFLSKISLKKTLLIIFLTTCRFCAPLFLKQITLSFKAGKIFHKLHYAPSKKEAEQIPFEISQILSQTFVFLDRGAQCYVFESLDKRCVLKLFKRNNKVFTSKSPSSSIQKFISSCEIAEQHLPKQTGLLFTHLYKTDGLLAKLYLTNPLNGKFSVNLDDCMFVLQKKVKTFHQAMLEDIHSSDDKSLNRKLESFFNSINNRLIQSIENEDPNLSTNFGFLGDDLIEIDVGNFRYKQQNLKIAKERYFELMHGWMQENCPEKLKLLEPFR